LGTGGYGTPGNVNGEFWDNSVAFDATMSWIKIGGNRIDTSTSYDTQIGIAAAIINSGVHRSDLFITSKTGNPYPMGYTDTLIQVDEILAQLKTSYVDLILLHWPGLFNVTGTQYPCMEGQTTFKKCRQESWLALIKAFNDGKARAIGVSNFEENQLQDIFELNTLLPSVNQVEYHPYWHEDNLVKFCKQNKIVYNSYSSVGVPDVMGYPENPGRWPVQVIEQPVIKELAAKYNKTAGQIVLSWTWQQGIVVNARSLSPVHQLENLNIFDFQMTPDEIKQVGSISPLPPNPKVCGYPNQIL